MPELPDSTTIEVANKIVENKSAFVRASKRKLLETIKSAELELIGRGRECVVVTARKHPEERKGFLWWKKPIYRDDVVVAIDYSNFVNPDKSRKIFYTQRIMSTLFPYNFPHFYSSFSGSQDDSFLGGTIRERINPQPKVSVKYPFGDVEATVKDLEIPVWFDNFEQNLITSENGGEYYVDKTALDTPYRDPQGILRHVWNSGKILSYMDQHNFSDRDKEIVDKSIKRLQDLTGEKEL